MKYIRNFVEDFYGTLLVDEGGSHNTIILYKKRPKRESILKLRTEQLKDNSSLPLEGTVDFGYDDGFHVYALPTAKIYFRVLNSLNRVGVSHES